MPTKEELKRATERARAAAMREAVRMSSLAKSPTQNRSAAAALRATLPEGYEEEYRAKEARKKALKERAAAVGKSQGERRSIFSSPKVKNENAQQKYNRERYEAFQEHGRRLKDYADRKYRQWSKQSGAFDEEVPDFDEEALQQLGPFVFKNPPPGVPAQRWSETVRYGDAEREIERDHALWKQRGEAEERANRALRQSMAEGGTEGSGHYCGGGYLNPAAESYIPRTRPVAPPAVPRYPKPQFGENPNNYNPTNRLLFPTRNYNETENPFLPFSVASVTSNVLAGEGLHPPRFHSREYFGRGRLGYMDPLPGSSRGW